MDDPAVVVEKTDRVATVLLSRPKRRNALGQAMLEELLGAFRDLNADRDIGVVVLAATGPAFSAGHDIAEMVDQDEDYYRSLFGVCSALMQTIRGLNQPVIAAVDGVATAAGCQLVAACDLAVATDTSTFATPGVKIGLFCSTPLVPISRTISQKRMMEMLLTGKAISAATALEWGLVNRVVPSNRLDAEIAELTAEVLVSSPTVIGLGKSAFYHQASLSEPAAYELMTEIMTANALLEDAQEGLKAFVEKRPAVWRDNR